MRTHTISGHENGVSEIIGAVLLISIVVLGAAFIGIFLFSQPPPQKIPSLSAQIWYDGNNVSIKHEGGDSLSAGEFKLFVNGIDETSHFSPTQAQWSIGQTLSYSTTSFSSAAVVYTGSGSSAVVLASLYPSGSHVIAAFAATGGNLTPSGMITVVEGGSQSFTISANTSYTVTDVLVDGVSKGVIPVYSFTNVVADHSISVAVAPVPGVTGIVPVSGPQVGGSTVAITGTGLTGATKVMFGSTPAASYIVNSDISITAISPAGGGTVDVKVTTPGGTSPTSSADQFTYVPAPSVTVLNPANGPTAGGTSVTISGSGFTGATAVKFGNTAATGYTVNTATNITAISPAGSVGIVNVSVTTIGGTSGNSTSCQFTYMALPTVTAINPSSGSVSGGTSVTLTGTGFTNATVVSFGAAPAPVFTVNSATNITATSPPGPAGTVNVTVTTPGGTSVTSPLAQFTYVALPVVNGITPVSGPLSGTIVSITGTGFTGATAVKFGASAAVNFTVNSATNITATAPAGAAGTVNVTVTATGGTSLTSMLDQFTYVALPVVTGITPVSGPLTSGTIVNITGTGFTGATAVKFGANPAVNYTVNSATTITATAPAGAAGAVFVTVTTPGGTSANSVQFTYMAVPTVTSLNVKFGPVAGGTAVTITGTSFTGATGVMFGSTPATMGAVTATTIAVTTPPGTGVVDVTVITPGGTSTIVAADKFTYAPTVTGVSPNSGLINTVVVVTGTDLMGATSVKFGATNAISFTPNSATSITATAPAGTLTVHITVTTPNGTSVISPADQFAYAPIVTSLNVNHGPAAGGTAVTITGTSFANATGVMFGSTPATMGAVTATTIAVTAPAGTGVVDVTVTTPAGTSAIVAADKYTYAPTVTGVSPNHGLSGTSVTLTGTGFTGATGVKFGATAATGVVVNSATSITATAPAGTLTVDVTVTTAAGTSPVTAADQFTYAPIVTSLSVNHGPAAGGTAITITGTSFTGATGVMFGSTPATMGTVTATTIAVTAPAGTGVVDVTVTTPAGTSAIVAADKYTYAPTVTGVSPNHGLSGTSVTLTGTGFTGATGVKFGATAATGVVVNSATSITATAPAGTLTVDVTVTTAAGTSPVTAADQFTYAPTVTKLTPATGSHTGSTPVTITGTSFTGATSLKFGTISVIGFTVVSSTTITVNSPPGTAGSTVDVTVTTPAGTSAIVAADQYKYT